MGQRPGLGPRCVDVGNPVADVSLNIGRVVWLYGLANVNTGSTTFFDLTKQWPGTIASLTTSSWRTFTNRVPAIDFPNGGTDGVVNLGAITGLAGGSALSFACTFVERTEGVSGFGRLFQGNDASPFSFFVNDAPGTSIIGRIVTSAGTTDITYTVAMGTRYRILLTWDGATVTGYLNGAAVGSSTRAGTLSAVASVSMGNRASLNRQFDGQIGDPCIWNRCLSAREADQDFFESQNGYPTLLRRYVPLVWSFGASGAAATGGAPILSGGILSSKIIGRGGVVS